MGSVSPLPFLVAPTTEQAAHEIILVHGFKNHLQKQTQVAKCREVLESWILDAAKPLRDQVNVRVFVFDGAHILHHGHVALSEAATELSERLEATRKEPSSPLFCPGEEDGNSKAHPPSSSLSPSSCHSSSRTAVFIAHGIGAWIVKELLNLLSSKGQKHIDPTGLIFLDVPNTLIHQATPDLRADYFLLEYLRELSRVFKLNAQEARIRNLRGKLSEVDNAFQKLTDSRYGECESIIEDDMNGDTFSMKIWCENVWMSTPSSKKTFLQQMGNLFLCGKRSKVELTLPRLGGLKLEEKLREAISIEGYNNPISNPKLSPEPGLESSPKLSPKSSYHTCFDDVPVEPEGNGEPSHSPLEEEDKVSSTVESSQNLDFYVDDDKAALKDWRIISRYLARQTKIGATGDETAQQAAIDRISGNVSKDTTNPLDWPFKEDKGKGKAIASKNPPKILESRKSLETQSSRSSSRPHTNKTQNDDDEVYDYDKAIIERDAAILLEDEEALQLAQHRLELVLWHQQEHLGKQHPKALITQRECITTSLVRGIWFVKPIVQWEKKDLLAVESQMRGVYCGLEESLGPLDSETMVALAVLLSIRVSLVQQQAIPWEAMELVLDMLRERQGAPEARTPDRLLHTLRTKYKVGVSLTRIWCYGDAMLEELLKEIDSLEGHVDRENVEGLGRLHREVKAKIEGLQRRREKRGRSRGEKRGR